MGLRQWGMMLLCVLFFSVAVAAEDTPPANDTDKWKLVEGQVKNLEASYKNAVTDLKSRFDVQQGHMKNLEESYKNALDDLNKKFEAQKKEIELKIQQIENDYRQKFWLLIFLLGFNILTLVGMFYSFNKWVFKKAEEKAKEKFETLLKEEKDRMFQLIRLEDDKVKLKQDKSLLVLTPPDGDETFLKDFFFKTGFKKYKFKPFRHRYSYNGEDLILLNNENGSLNDDKRKVKKEAVDLLISGCPNDTFFFHFGPGQIHFPPEIQHFSFASARVQLYGNLMNALLYQDIVK